MTTAILAGLGAALPGEAIGNEEIAARLGVTDDWILSRTGIRQRHLAGPGTATSDLAVEAGERALKSAGDTEVDAVILATATPDHPIPATAPAVAARLGLAGSAAFDVGAVCAGFVYGLATGASLIAGGIAGKVLVIGADVFSTVVRADDPVNAAIFGDGAGAVVLRAGNADQRGALTAFDLGSDGENADLIQVSGGGSRQRASGRPAEPDDMWFAMQGKRVFTAAVTRMTQSSRSLLERLGRTAGDVDRIVGHQANVRILRAVADQLDVPVDRLVVHLDRVGNTSAASIPLALADAAANGTLRGGELVLMTAFGGGLAWGSTACVWPDQLCVG